jgi:hypothetical protein
MHIIIGALGTIVTMLILLNKLAEAGIDLGGLNPFLWHRRRKWQKKYEGNPIYQIENAMDVTAILLVATAKVDGDMTKNDKSLITKIKNNQDIVHPSTEELLKNINNELKPKTSNKETW